VSVDVHPTADFETRVIATDLWLVERGPDGREHSQALSLRGLPNRPMPYYFDRLMDGTSSLEIIGQVVARIEKDAIRVSLQARSKSLPVLPYDRSAPGSRQTEAVIQVKPDEIVEVPLPRLGTDAGPFANRPLSIRIRARQLR
jgi:hypothetical protein